MVQYQITHDTTYNYASPVTRSSHLVHLAPRQIEAQKVDQYQLTATPEPATQSDHIDYFGNAFSILTLEEMHERFTLRSQSMVEVTAPVPIDPKLSPAWETVQPGAWSEQNPEIVQYQCYSKFTRPNAAIHAYGRKSFPKGKPVLAAVEDLTARIHNDFKYDSTTTDVSTPVAKVFEIRSGVCQDFAHLQLTCLRALGIPARYVSGYLRTYPPKGQPRLVGADASHAWVSVWSPGQGWVDFDPTNNKMVSDEHITVAYGRDFNDVSPVSGVILGGGHHFVDVKVDVMPLD